MAARRYPYRFAEMSTFEARVPLVVLVVRPGVEKKAEETVTYNSKMTVLSPLSNLSHLNINVRVGDDPSKMCNGVVRVMTDMGAFGYEYKMTTMRLKGRGNSPNRLDIFKIIAEHRDVFAGKCNVAFDSTDEAHGIIHINLRFVYSEQGMRGRYVDLIFTGKRDLPADPDARLGTVRMAPRLVEMLAPCFPRQ
jgi:hypothetical protein